MGKSLNEQTSRSILKQYLISSFIPLGHGLGVSEATQNWPGKNVSKHKAFYYMYLSHCLKNIKWLEICI